MNREDLTGRKFGRLTVIGPAEDRITPSGQRKPHWVCKCDCGSEVIVAGTHLKSGHTQSCGCFQSENTSKAKFVDIAGQRFGKLVALCPVKQYKKHTKWTCKCDCGKYTYVDISNLLSGKTLSCGCLMSKAEYILQQYLTQNDILYIQQYKFIDCADVKSLPFDFAIFNYKSKELMFLVELQGEQHYYPFTFNGESQEQKEKNLEERKRLDKIKLNYCKNHKIQILYIKYTHFNRIEEIFQKFYQQMLNEECVNKYEYHEKEMRVHKHKRYRAKVCQIDVNSKEVVARYDTITEAAIAVNGSDGAISDCCNRKAYMSKGYAWAYDEDGLDVDGVVAFARSKEKHIGGKRKVLQYDKAGNLIKEWGSMTDAANYYNLKHSNIYNCCKGKQKTAGGYIWKYNQGGFSNGKDKSRCFDCY